MPDITTLMMAAAGAAGEDVDPDFANTVLLLHGDGTNGAQNNTFLDSSTNNFTITRNGNTTQGSFTPFSKPDGRWGNFFDGTNDRLTIADNAALRPGTGNFTIEAWVYRAAAGAAHTVFAKGGASTGFVLGITSGNVLRFTHTTTNIDSTGTVAANAWVHVAVVREGTGTNQVKLYINGVQDGQGTVSTDFNQTEEARIGEDRGATDDFNGYISNFRYVIGSAIYTTAFTPSTLPLTTTSQGAVSSEVELLTCQSNRFKDNSTNGFTVTPVNDVKVTPFSPFPITTEYSPSVNGGSGYFDGSGDYASLSGNAAFAIATSSTPFTIETWIYPTASGGIIFTDSYTGGGDTISIMFGLGEIGDSNGLTPYLGSFNGSAYSGDRSDVSLTLNTWSHVACVFTGSAVAIYINGTSVATTGHPTGGKITSWPVTGDNGDSWYIGRRWDANTPTYITGYLSSLRFVNNSAVYSGNFTTPTAPLTAIANTSLLCNFTNAGIFDNTCFNNLETVGNAQIDTTTKKYGTGSLEFDGTGDWLIAPNTPDLQLGTGNFTIEFWVYLATGDTGSNRGLVAKGGASTGFLVSLNTTQKVVFTFTTSTITSSGAITTNAWNHIAVVREGTGSNQTKIYIAGTNDGTGTVSTNFNQTEILYIGANRVGGDPMKGFIDDLRITKGVARYTTTFTPPTAAFPNIGS